MRRGARAAGSRRAITGLALAVLAGTAGLALAVAAPAASAGTTSISALRTGEACPATHPGFHCMAMNWAASLSPVSHGYSPQQLQQLYKITPNLTAGTTVAVVDAYRTVNVANALDGYCVAMHLGCSSLLNLSVVDEWGNPIGSSVPVEPGAGTGWAEESTMDVEMVAAMCPSCHILLVSANSDDRDNQANLERAVSTAATQASYVSMSWGADESLINPTAGSQVLGAASSVIFTAAAGDWSGDLPIWPASSPNTVAVGGTHVIDINAGTESAWAQGGSMCAGLSGRPAWQSAFAAVVAACPRRAAADLAVVADPATGVAVYVVENNGANGWAQMGGTSVGAPLVAAMYALAGNHTQRYAPYTHLDGTDFYDVTSGNNTYPGLACAAICAAAAGWDGPTGVGSPRGLGGFAPGTVLRNPGTVHALVGNQFGINLSSAGIGTGAGAPYTFSGTLPAGVTPSSTGQTSGTVRALGSGTATVTANDGKSATQFRWTISNKITVNALPNRTSTYATPIGRFRVTAKNSTAGTVMTYTATGLPPGTVIDRATGIVSGTPKHVGSYGVHLSVRDATGGLGTRTFTWHVLHRFVRTSATVLRGAARAGVTLHAYTGTLRRDTTAGAIVRPAVTFTWLKDGKPIRGATTGAYFRVPASDRGHKISYRYTAHAGGYSNYIQNGPTIKIS